jgi:hypothetical protein
MSNEKLKKDNGIISDDDCYFTCIACDQKARKVYKGKCVECCRKEHYKVKSKVKAKPHIDRFLANDPADW